MDLTSLWALVLDWALVWDHPVSFCLALFLYACIEHTLGCIALLRSMVKVDRLGRPSLISAAQEEIMTHSIGISIALGLTLHYYPSAQRQLVWLYLCDLISLSLPGEFEIKVRKAKGLWRLHQQRRMNDEEPWASLIGRALERTLCQYLSQVMMHILEAKENGGIQILRLLWNNPPTAAASAFVDDYLAMVCWHSPSGKVGSVAFVNQFQVVGQLQSSWRRIVSRALPCTALPLLELATRTALAWRLIRTVQALLHKGLTGRAHYQIEREEDVAVQAA